METPTTLASTLLRALTILTAFTIGLGLAASICAATDRRLARRVRGNLVKTGLIK